MVHPLVCHEILTVFSLTAIVFTVFGQRNTQLTHNLLYHETLTAVFLLYHDILSKKSVYRFLMAPGHMTLILGLRKKLGVRLGVVLDGLTPLAFFYSFFLEIYV